MNLLLWKVNGYQGNRLTKKILENPKWSFDELKKADSKIIKEMEKILDNNGEIFILSNEKIIKAAYLFKITTENDKNILQLDKKVVLEEVNNCVEEFENDIETILGDILSLRTNIDKAIWKEKELEKTKVKIGKYEISTAIIWILIGVIFWLLFDDYIWFVMYLCIGAATSFEVKYNVVKKNKNKSKKTKNK